MKKKERSVYVLNRDFLWEESTFDDIKRDDIVLIRESSGEPAGIFKVTKNNHRNPETQQDGFVADILVLPKDVRPKGERLC